MCFEAYFSGKLAVMRSLTTALLPFTLSAAVTVDPVRDLGLTPTPTILGQKLAVAPNWARIGEGSLARLADGTLLLAFDARERGGDMDRSRILAVRSTDEGATWSSEVDLLADAHASILQPSLCILGDGAVGLTYSRLLGPTQAAKWFRRSSDGGATWSEPVAVSHSESPYVTGAHDRLYRLTSGRLVALAHAKLEPIPPNHGKARLGTYVMISDDDGRTWRCTTPDALRVNVERPGGEHGLWECALVEHAPDALLLVGRTATGWMWQSRSTDGGLSWATPEQSDLPNPLAPVWLTRQPDGDTLYLVQNLRVDLDSGWHGGRRDCLALRRSDDAGRTWSAPTAVEFTDIAEHWFDYPHGLWLSPTRLLLVYRCPVGNGSYALHRVGIRMQVLDLPR